MTTHSAAPPQTPALTASRSAWRLKGSSVSIEFEAVSMQTSIPVSAAIDVDAKGACFSTSPASHVSVAEAKAPTDSTGSLTKRESGMVIVTPVDQVVGGEGGGVGGEGEGGGEGGGEGNGGDGLGGGSGWFGAGGGGEGEGEGGKGVGGLGSGGFGDDLCGEGEGGGGEGCGSAGRGGLGGGLDGSGAFGGGGGD